MAKITPEFVEIVRTLFLHKKDNTASTIARELNVQISSVHCALNKILAEKKPKVNLLDHERAN